MPYEKTIVKKPWGYEYLVYQNDKVALWFLCAVRNSNLESYLTTA